MDWTRIINEGVLPIVVSVLLGFTAVVMRAAVKWFEAKTAIAVDAHTEALLADVVEGGVHQAEEWARGEVRRKLADTPPIAHDEKLAKAVDFVLAEMKRRDVPTMARDEVTRLVEAKLGEMRVQS